MPFSPVGKKNFPGCRVSRGGPVFVGGGVARKEKLGAVLPWPRLRGPQE